MTHAAHIALIEHELDGFHQSLVVYRQQMNAWYSRALDSASHALDMPSLLGMDRVLRVGDSQRSVSMTDPDFIGAVASCQLGGELKIESTFESVYDVTIKLIRDIETHNSTFNSMQEVIDASNAIGLDRLDRPRR